MINPNDLKNSIEMVGAPSDGNIYKFQCKNVDAKYLPTAEVGAGSKCIVYDASKVLTYSVKSKSWQEMK